MESSKLERRPAAFVTGASSGTGREASLALAKAGYDVALLGRRPAALEDVAADIRGAAGEARTICLRTDVTDPANVARSVAAFLEWSGGRVEVLLNAAGIPGPLGAAIGDIAVEDFDAVVSTNLRGPFLTMTHLLPVMYRQGGGRVVNIGGNHGLRGRAGRSTYSLSKWGLRGLTRSAALEAGPHGVTVNYVAPGAIAVDRMRLRWKAQAAEEGVSEQVVIERYVAQMGIALGRPNEPADVVAMIMFLVGEGGRNITGQELVIDGGVIV
ncbi:SDR family NAD(P)-dependent oxidoreductase [Telmatospirillum siberiense]|uniref:3-ketoacyl-ACP reductase n=1 Tax=Telmatospirillum siberiense TaxID=382514 RepID=A0A2N3PPU6_9PROT|nr:SDR family NAD(P)-dependent oxidoreductase [Telmatospirillum siberiense]PKU22414.1 3-ketoacyl-ACP reductase [Telmatospirillum siberiense]